MQMSRFINTEIKSDSESSDSGLDSEKIGAKVDTELLEKSASDLNKSFYSYVFVYAYIFEVVRF